MTRHNPSFERRTALRTVAGLALTGVAGCLNSRGSTSPDTSATSSGDSTVFQRIAVDGTELIVEFASGTSIDRINLIQPNGELFAQRDVATGAQQVTFELGTSYAPGEYEIVALSGEEPVGKRTKSIQPEIHIRGVGLYRNNPEKRWDEVYGESKTDRLKNGEAFVKVENTGSGPEAIVELVFSGDVPNPIDDPRGSGMYETEQVVIAPGETKHLFSNSFPFGSESEEGMGCSLNGNSGQFTVTVETRVGGNRVSNTFEVRYSGSRKMSDCEVSITEA